MTRNRSCFLLREWRWLRGEEGAEDAFDEDRRFRSHEHLALEAKLRRAFWFLFMQTPVMRLVLAQLGESIVERLLSLFGPLPEGVALPLHPQRHLLQRVVRPEDGP